MRRTLLPGLALLLAWAPALAGQEVPRPAPPAAAEPVAEAMLYERDFELLLEQAGVPTAGQLALDEQLAALEAERAVLTQRRAALQARLDSISGTYTMIQAAEEITRQGVRDVREARKNLERDVAEVQGKLTLLGRKERDLRERRAR